MVEMLLLPNLLKYMSTISGDPWEIFSTGGQGRSQDLSLGGGTLQRTTGPPNYAPEGDLSLGNSNASFIASR